MIAMTVLVDAILAAHGDWCDRGLVEHCQQCRTDDNLTTLLEAAGVSYATGAHLALVGGAHPTLVDGLMRRQQVAA